MRKIFLIFIFLPLFVFALNCEETEKICQNLARQDCLKILEECVKIYEGKIEALEKEAQKKEKEKKTLTNEIYLLKKKIEKLNFEIQQTDLLIKETDLQIKETEEAIQKTKERLDAEKKRLVEILRAIFEAEKQSFFEILIFEKSLSDFFNDLFYLENLNEKSKEALNSIKDLKLTLEGQKKALEFEKESQEKLLAIQNLQKKEVEETKKEKDYFLKLTEAEYQKLLKEKRETEMKAAEIRKRIFELVGVEKAPTFGEAYEIAKYVEKITGVRTAFLLAILTQESNLGKNVGQCYLKDLKSGAGVRINNGEIVQRVMAPGPPYSSRNDVFYFLKITEELGRDPFFTPVSCPMSFGWGGAMGPAQFLPTTWLKYKQRLSSILGRTPDPWKVLDSFLAAGLFLADHGASQKTPEAEWNAALIYFSGTLNSKFNWYAKSVFALARQYEADIRILERALAQIFFEGRNYKI